MAGITLLLGLLTLNRLGSSDVCGGSEAAMAVYVQQMVEHDQLLFPLDNCAIPMYKPPLYHWTAAGLAALLGATAATAFNLRLPSALYAIGGAILTMAFAAKLLGLRGAILAGLILCGSYQYVSQARIGLVDMTLTFYETLAVFSFFYWFTLIDNADVARRRTAVHYLLAIAMGLAVLAKGPVGALLPGAAILIFLLIERQQAAFLTLLKTGPLVLGAALASSWYIACAIGHRYDFLHLQIGTENFGRFFGGLGAMPPWYYVQPLLLNSLPLSLFVPAAVTAALLRLDPPQTEAADVSTTPIIACGSGSTAAIKDSAAPRAATSARLLAIFWLFSVGFFDLAAYKRRAYLLPLWPASAFLLAWWTVERVIPFIRHRYGKRDGMMVYRGAIAACLLAAAANFLFIPPYELRECGVPFSFASLFRWAQGGIGKSASGGFQPDSYRAAAARINDLTQAVPLYSLGFQEALEPLVFYLRRCAAPLSSPVSVPLNARIIAPARVWNRMSGHYPNLRQRALIPYDHDALVLLGSSTAVSPGN